MKEKAEKIKIDYYDGVPCYWGGINVRVAKIQKLIQAKRYLELQPSSSIRKAWIEVLKVEIGKR